jgi:hypothetical protein
MRSLILILTLSAIGVCAGCTKSEIEDFDRPRLYRSAIQFTVSDAMPHAMPAAVFDLASRKLHAAVGRELAPIQGYEVLLVPQIDSGYRLMLLTPRRLTEDEEQRIAKLVSPAFSEATAEWRTREAKRKNG